MEKIIKNSDKKIIVRKNGTLRVQTDFTDVKDHARQDFAEQCDVNEIVSKFNKTGQVTHLQKMQGQIADVSEIPDLLEAMTTVTRAQQTFNQLPATLRDRFGNSPVQLISFLQNPENDKEAVELGLKHLKAIETPLEDRIAKSYKNIEEQKQKKRSPNDDDSNDDARAKK